MNDTTEKKMRQRQGLQFTVLLDRDDRSLLERISTAEKLTQSDILRRAIRLYAKELGIDTAA